MKSFREMPVKNPKPPVMLSGCLFILALGGAFLYLVWLLVVEAAAAISEASA